MAESNMARQETIKIPSGVPRKEGRIPRSNVGRIITRGALAGLTIAGIIGAVKIAKDEFEDNVQRYIMESNMKKGDYEMEPVPERQPDSAPYVATSIGIIDLPQIPDKELLITPNITLGAKLREAHQILVDSKPAIFPSVLEISGYYVGKEIRPDGSVMFAIELPYLTFPKDVSRRKDNNTGEVVSDPKDGRTVVGGRIIWLKLFEGDNPASYPLNTTVGWGQRAFQAIAPSTDNKGGSGDKPLMEYAQNGDLIRARVELDRDVNQADIQAGIGVFLQLENNGETQENATNRFKEIINANAHNSRALIEQAGDNIGISDQLKNKPYTFVPTAVVFLPK